MDRILIKDLAVRCIIGVNEDERHEKQEVLINIALYTDLSKPGKTDDLQDSLDYRAIKKQVLAVAEDSHYYLIEALAEKVAALCLEADRVARVQVTVEKPSALRFARSVGVEVTRERT